MEAGERKTVWLVSARAGDQRRDFEFSTRIGETPQDTYRRVKSNAEKISTQLEGRAIVDIISMSIAFKPKGKRPHKSWYWCPYCAKWRIFKFNEKLGVNKCCICGVSDQDFYVRNYNHLWKTEMTLDRRTRK